ncbi:sugar phosphate nucleotidyltransferase [Siphonobacter curvatus]|uniref:Nucleotidyltransferase n=1 Tax=Siphonobacter curvatus TaxID=2094562 RepID=A0A2S7ITC0_9BACT|nr:sugar phosphate nucleotidyltransferase [Siphonobacter curvatus]PQA60922.1 nucleotidyltransferase [Siphonobacter curvatus]
MNKRILILAGGMSSRMKKAVENLALDPKLVDQANTLTKGMISVGTAGQSLIDYQLMNAVEAGFTEALLLLHPEDSLTQAYYESNAFPGLSIRFARQYIAADRQKPAGTADAVLQALQQTPEWQQGRLVICNSDNLYSTRALELLWNNPYPNALVSYDRNALLFPAERIQAFALIRTNAEGFLLDIHEKPSEAEVEAARQQTGRVGVSMNLFALEAQRLMPCLEATPFHPIRNEKELPTAVNLLAQLTSVYTLPLSENVPDLTNKEDIATVQQYLREKYSSLDPTQL